MFHIPESGLLGSGMYFINITERVTKMYVAIINTPGYLPMDDEPPVFGTPGAAWAYLADVRRQDEDSQEYAPSPLSLDYYSETVHQLDAYAQTNHGEDTVYGDTPGSESDHDLGLAYSVQVAETEPERKFASAE